MAKDERELEIIKLRDFYQAVILKTLGFSLLELERGGGKFVNFVFENGKGRAKQALNDYWDRKIHVEARQMIETINELKTRIYSKN